MKKESYCERHTNAGDRGVGNIRYTGDASSVHLDTVALVNVSSG